MGDVSDLHPFIPCKVPLGGRIGQGIEPQYQFTPENACVMAHDKLSAFIAAKQAQTVRCGRWVVGCPRPLWCRETLRRGLAPAGKQLAK
jgi:hypothetical protein